MRIDRRPHLFLSLLFLMCTSSIVWAADIEMTSHTIIRAFERNTPQDEKDLILPLYEYLGVDYGNPDDGGLSAHFYGWGRWEMADSAFFDEVLDGELLYGYLEYSKPYHPMRISLGRRHIFAGVTNDTIDGLRVVSDLGLQWTIDIFGGLVDASDQEEAAATYGGRLAFHPRPYYDLALSYQKANLTTTTEEKAGVDFSLNFSPLLSLSGISSYSIKNTDWREHSYEATLHLGDFSIVPTFQFFSYQDYFDTDRERNPIFSFLTTSDEQVTILGTDLLWQTTERFSLGVRANFYTYDIRATSANYYAALTTFQLSGGSQIGAEWGRMNGDTPDTTYTLWRVFLYWAIASKVFISADGLMLQYDAPVYDKDSAVEVCLSAGSTYFNEALEIKLSGIYAQDPYFDQDIGSVLSIIYRY